jgi:hypothetical protein
VQTPRNIVPSADGGFLVTGNDGLFRVDETGAHNLDPGLSFDANHYLRELRVTADLAVVDDYGYGLQIVSTDSGEVVESIELDHYASGLDITEQQIVVGSETVVVDIDSSWSAGGDD